ncbi:MAG TPA: FAD-dependent oxidoreductase [Candidatus Baltobacteraceae bacterium]|nr:FAD-dependent oxidoreductase [Candidatus Baltobacteraceae bacterium]
MTAQGVLATPTKDLDMVEEVEFLVVGAGPAGATAAREAARAGIETMVLEKDAVIGAKRVCAAGLRPGFCATFDLPSELIHCNTPRLALFDASGREHEIFFGPGHTTTREELDGAIAALAAREGAAIRTQCLWRSFERDREAATVEYADLRVGKRRRVRARNVFFAQGATARFNGDFADERWSAGLMTTLQYRVYLDRPAAPAAYRTLELHYYAARDGRQIVAWMFPKRDHLAIGLGLVGKLDGSRLREELDAFTARTQARLYPDVTVERRKEEGHLLYGGWPRASYAAGAAMLGGTAAGLVDATNGEGIFEAAMSGRFAAAAIREHRNAPERAARAYEQRVRARFSRRLEHRVRLMRFLEARPARYGVLFDLLHASPRFADALQREDHERSLFDRVVLAFHALRFGMRASHV